MTKIDTRLDRLGDALHGAASADLARAAPATKAAGGPVRSPSWRHRRGPRLALGGTLALAAAAVALIFSAGGDNPPAAYAVEPQPGGGVKIKIYDLGEPEGVEAALEQAGIASQVTYLPDGMTCREPHYTPSMATLRTLEPGQPQPQPWAGFDWGSINGPLTIAIGNYQQRKQMNEEIREELRQGNSSTAEWPSFVVDPTGFRPDQTLIISSAPPPPGYQQPPPKGSENGRTIRSHYLQGRIDSLGQVRVAEGEVGPCEPVPAGNAPASAPVRAPRGGWDFSQLPYAGWGF
jgi:hypothetical protein